LRGAKRERVAASVSRESIDSRDEIAFDDAIPLRYLDERCILGCYSLSGSGTLFENPAVLEMSARSIRPRLEKGVSMKKNMQINTRESRAGCLKRDYAKLRKSARERNRKGKGEGRRVIKIEVCLWRM